MYKVKRFGLFLFVVFVGYFLEFWRAVLCGKLLSIIVFILLIFFLFFFFGFLFCYPFDQHCYRSYCLNLQLSNLSITECLLTLMVWCAVVYAFSISLNSSFGFDGRFMWPDAYWMSFTHLFMNWKKEQKQQTKRNISDKFKW